jgi:chromosome partitioning protein
MDVDLRDPDEAAARASAHQRAHVIALCNQKGGVGKTTTAINLGASLVELGYRVLLVDFDPQGAASVGLGVNPHTLERTVYDVLLDTGGDVGAVVAGTAVRGLDLLPANIDLSAAELQLVTEVGLLTLNALCAADRVLVPLECEFFALRGVALLMDTIEKVQRRLNPDLRLLGVLATMYDGRTVHSREVLQRLREGFGDKLFTTVVNRTIKFPETSVAGVPITTYAPTSAAALAHRELAAEVLARLGSPIPRGLVPAPPVEELMLDTAG